MKWVTRERPVIDRMPALGSSPRFIDKQHEFLFVPLDQVTRVAAETGAIPYDVPGVEFTHVGEGYPDSKNHRRCETLFCRRRLTREAPD